MHSFRKFKDVSRMQLRFCIALCLFFLTQVSVGGEIKSITEALFWKIESDRATMYILGSIHLASDEFYPLPDTIEEAFEQSDYLVVEVDITNVNQQELIELISRHGRFQDGLTLSQILPDSTYEAVKNEFAQFGLNILQFEQMKPWVAAITLSQLQMVKFGYRPEYGIDLYFLSDAREQKTILELESGVEQISIFSNLSMDLQIMLLEDFLYDLTLPRERIHELFDAYKRWDAEWIRDFVFESVDTHPQLRPLYEKLLDQRNIKMAKQLDSFLQNGGTYFVVVGAGHLFGEMGIVDLLRRKGYTPVALM